MQKHTDKDVAFLEAAIIKRRQAAQSPDEEHDMQNALAFLEARDELMRQLPKATNAREKSAILFHAQRAFGDAKDLLASWED